MKKYITTILVLLFIAFVMSGYFSNNVYAQSDLPTSTPTINSPTPTPVVAGSDSEVLVLQTQLEVMRQYNDQLISTVYWSLGTIAALAVLLVGFGWFVNFRIYERDKETMKEDLRNFVKSELETLSQLLITEMNAKSEENLKNAQNAFTKSVQGVQSKMNSLEVDITEMRYFDAEKEAESESFTSTKFNRYVRMIELTQKLPSYLNYYYSEPLENITKLLQEGFVPDPENVRDLNKALDGVPKDYSVDVDSIRELVKNSRKGKPPTI